MLFKKFKKQENEEIDSELIMYIQPRGGISFKDEKVIKTGDGYEICIHVYAISSDANLYWLSKLTNIQNVITTIDVSPSDINVIKDNISKSIDENVQRKIEAKHHSDANKAEKNRVKLKKLYDEIEEYGEVIKYVHIRLFVFDSSIPKVESRCEKILASLSTEYGVIPFINETYNEYKTMFQSYTQQKDVPIPCESISVKGSDLARGLPFYYSSLRDPMGTHLGYTSCGGVVLFDYFLTNRIRKSFSAMVSGSLGMGKSTILKKLLLDRAARGDYIRAFDIAGEFVFLGREYGARIVKLDGSEGRMNLLQILKTAEDNDMNYVNHISKMRTIYALLKKSASSEELDMFEAALNELYMKWNLTAERMDSITDLPAKSYPTFTDLYNVIVEKMKGLKKLKRAADVDANIILLNNVSNTINNLVSIYGNIFDGISSFENFSSEQIVIFDISTIKNVKAEIFDALIINAISLCLDGAIQNGAYYKDLYEQGKISNDKIVHTLTFVDEAHRFINTRKLQAVSLIQNFIKEGRKWYMGIIMATPSIRNFILEGSDKGIDELKTIFELCQYKFIFRQDSSMKPLLRKIFDGELTETEINRIPVMQEGDAIMVISGDRNIDLKVYATQEELSMFRGGA